MTEHDAIERLAALLDGEVAAADAAGPLGSLLTLAETVRDHADLVAPAPGFRSALRAELLAVADAPPGLAARVRTAWSTRTTGLRASARVAMATLTASSMIGTAGVAAAAQEAIPGDALYGLKGLTEDARLLLADGDVAEARLHLSFARERLEELTAGAGRLDADQVVDLLAAMDAHSEAGAQALLDGLAAGLIDAEEIRDFTRGQRSGLVGLFDALPLLARPVAEDSIELLRRIEVNASGITATAACDCDDPRSSRTTRTRSASAPGGGADVAAPGEGPALTPFDCDCIDLPGGATWREPALSRDQDRAATASGGGAGQDEPFRPSGTFSDPQPEDDTHDDGAEDRDSPDLTAPSSSDQLPLGEVDDGVEPLTEPVTDADTSDGVATRAQDGLDGLLG